MPSAWFGIVVPKGTPQQIVQQISKTLEAALATTDVQQKLDVALRGQARTAAGVCRCHQGRRRTVGQGVVKEAGITAD